MGREKQKGLGMNGCQDTTACWNGPATL